MIKKNHLVLKEQSFLRKTTLRYEKSANNEPVIGFVRESTVGLLTRMQPEGVAVDVLLDDQRLALVAHHLGQLLQVVRHDLMAFVVGFIALCVRF